MPLLKVILVSCLIVCSLVGSIFIGKKSPKRYLILYVASSLTGIILCYGFVRLNFYSFPFHLTPLPIPMIELVTVLPFIVIGSVCFSPQHWRYKIPFYWVIVHSIMALEVFALHEPLRIIEYRNHSEWDVWDSYTLWWIYLLLFEYVGGLVIPALARRPINSANLLYGRLGWLVIHVILISTIFLAGFYLGFNAR